ncbi:MAG: 3'(2'),5'-bisphosphate nucleotidase CysQ [Streptosporangiales bacterium]|nr:3'(2'),5'-bisphosphate nucleotidase CysQ [Streptosporangiales bacterium]
MTNSNVRDDHELARDLATDAGELLLRLRDKAGFADPRVLRDTGDRESHEYLMAALARTRPGDAVLSEEGKDDPARLAATRVWIVDPLDGTREFAEEGRTDWAVHVALWEAGRLTAGAVALPAQGRTLGTYDPPALPARDGGPVRIAASRTRAPALVEDLARRLDEEGVGAELVPMGSAGAKIAAVLQGTVDAYLHAGGQYEWDSAAPVAVVQAAGAHATRIDGTPLTYNQADPYLPDILVSRPELGAMLLTGVRDVAPS